MKPTNNLRLKGIAAFLTLMLGCSIPFQAQCPTISTASASSTSLCEGQSTILNATALGTGTVSWYTSSTGGSFLGSSLSGTNFSVSPVSTMTYYAEPLVQSVVNFGYTGSVQEYTVPPGVNTITVDLAGAAGGTGLFNGIGGLGGRVTGTIAVTPGDVLNIFVGGAGTSSSPGYNGGGNCPGSGGGGGGASDIRIGGITFADRVAVAGGGGGGNQGPGGAGGGLIGASGSSVGLGVWATGGTQIAGGSGGMYNNGSCAPGAYASSGALGLGGAGILGNGGCTGYGGAGGGGGYYGGGGMQINGAGGGSSYLADGTHTQGFQAGNGYINLTVPICSSLTRVAVLVNVYPNPTVSVSGGTICAGDSFTLNPSGAISYTYEGGSAVVSPGSNSSYTIVGSNGDGCVSQTYATATILVNSLPSVVLNTSSNIICEGESVILSASGANSYSWSTGASTNSIQVSPTGNSSYTLNGYDANGCFNSAIKDVTVNPLPVVIISGTNAICAGNSVTLSAGGALNYSWNSGSSANSIVVSPGSNTNYSVTGESSQGCQSTTTIGITVYALPVVAISGTNAICSGNSVTLTAGGADTYNWSNGASSSYIIVSPTSNANYSVVGTSTDGCAGLSSPFTLTVHALPLTAISGSSALCYGQTETLTASGATSYLWNTGSTSASLPVTPATNTSYTLTGFNTYGCSFNDVINLNVHPLPVMSIAGTATLCSGGSTTLTASGASTYLWNGGSTSSALVVNPTSNTTYSVTGTSSMGCQALASTPVTVHTLPLVIINGTTGICAGSSATLSASGANTYLWNNASTNNSIVVSPGTNTNYSVTGTGSDGCIGQSSLHTLTVFALPATTISGTNSICFGQTTTLSANGANSYLWSTGSGNINLAVSPTVNTTYSLTGISAVGCANNAVLNMTVNALPIMNVSGTFTLCNGESTTLTASGANSYLWSGGSGNANLIVSPSSNTTYSVTGTSNYGCVAGAAITVTAYALPVLNISGNTTICAGNSSTLTAGGANTYLWSNGSSNTSIVISPLSNTTYSVIGTSVMGCSVVSAPSQVIVNVLPLTGITGTNAICTSLSATLTAGGASTYVWSNASAAGSIVVSPTTTTTYSVVGTSSNGCIASAIHTLTVYALPLVNITAPAAICNGQSATLTASGANTYTWNTNATAISIIVQPTLTTTYSVYGTSTFGCLNNTLITLTVNANPVLNVSGTGSLCSGQTASFTASGANTYSWNTGATTALFTVTPLATAFYSVTGSSVANCKSVATTSVLVYSLPNLTLALSAATICTGETATLSATGALSYNWSGGQTTNSIVVAPNASAQYTVTGKDVRNCSASKTTALIVSSCTDLQQISARTSGMKVFPNPGNGEFTIEVPATNQTFITVIDLLGQTLVNMKAENSNHLDLKNYTNGLYFVRVVEQGKVIYSTTVIKQ